MTLRSILDDAIVTLRGIPDVVLEADDVLAPPSAASLRELADQANVRLPSWVTELYTQLGGAHISWRLAPAGYQWLYPGRTDNTSRYDISGNLDILTINEMFNGIGSHPWNELHGSYAANYRPVDYSSFNVNLGFVATASGCSNDLILLVRHDRILLPLGITPTEYLRRAADLLFMNEWQLSLTDNEEYSSHASSVKNMRTQLLERPSRR